METMLIITAPNFPANQPTDYTDPRRVVRHKTTMFGIRVRRPIHHHRATIQTSFKYFMPVNLGHRLAMQTCCWDAYAAGGVVQ